MMKSFWAKKSRVKITLVNTDSFVRRTRSPQEKSFSLTIEFSQWKAVPKREVRKSISSLRVLKFQVGTSFSLLPFIMDRSWTYFKGPAVLGPSTRSGRGNGLLSEYLEDRRLIGHLNEVLSRDRREKWSFSMETVFRDSNESPILLKLTYLKI